MDLTERPLFTVDPDKCNRDGICAATCPMMIVMPPEEGGVPFPAKDADKLCISCGHCLSVCPTAALSLRFMDPAECQPTPKDLTVGPEQAQLWFKGRRSIRRFKSEPADHETLAALMDIANYGPSGKNARPVRWMVLEKPSMVEKAAEIFREFCAMLREKNPEMYKRERFDSFLTAWEYGKDLVCFHAPHVVIAYGNVKDRRTTPAALIALAHIDLASRSFGLGACFAGYLNFAVNAYPPLKQWLGIPGHEEAVQCLLIGKPKYKYHRIPTKPEPDMNWK